MIANNPTPRELELNAALDSKITAVTLYPYQADITRTFHCQLDSGSTQVKIATGLPSSFDETKIKISVGQGVVLGDVKTPWGKSDTDPDYAKVDALYDKKSLLQKSLERCKRMTTALDNYAQATLDGENEMSPLDVGRFLDSYEETQAKWDSKVESLKKEIREVDDKINSEEDSDGPSDPSDGPKYSRTSITFSLKTETPTSVSFNLTYGVTMASWYAGYDVLATSDNDQAVTLVYKAIVRNNTGEPWEDVDLKVGSTAPQKTAARLQSWSLSFRNNFNDLNATPVWPPAKVLTSTEISLPEKITLRDKTEGQTVVIGRYLLAAQFSRLCTPRVSGSVYLKAKVTNTSGYPLVSGSSGVYLDGDFVSNSYIPSINVGETFDLALGVDPGIQAVYHPCTKDATPIESPSPFAYKPVATYSCSQPITVTNTRDIPISSLTVIDSIPTTGEIDISIKLVNPPLKYPEATAPGFKNLVQARTGMPVVEGIPTSCSVFARWDMVDETLHDLSSLGANGKMNWVCSIAEKESIDLNLQWQVLVYSGKQIKDFDL
ncbi:hypothetical protein D9756_003001 [Leucocoprinus leucothites]|uniref:Mucoidy inhibitor A n=1 Tax=Leucocoprinus leucothites TaxID=201217 RepID=A0A8H5G7L6_9AGAR|nr:hypothetical protein D9756_003001 [Leucoagaricus leucothites]